MTRTAFVTGGVSGIGAATATRLREGGVQVVTCDLSDRADVVLDVADSHAVGEAARSLGPIDIVVNAAGIVGPNVELSDIDDDSWARTLAVNLTGTFHVCRAFVPGMRERGWGRIVNIASIAGKEGNPRLAAYSASKAGVIALTKSLGKELAQSGVLVNAIAPGVIATPMNDATAPEVLARLTSLIPMGRMGEAEEVAELAYWLASEAVSFSTGSVYDASGGRATY